jgi:signal peptidase I
MQPTLETKDRLIIWKAGRTWARITKSDFIPERGEIVVFIKKGMYNFDTNKEKQLIKRVIALPGERVVVRDGTMTVYNDASPNGFSPDALKAYGKDIKEPTDGNVDITVGPGEIFVSGDNRDNSLDSRSFGAVPTKDIVGTLSLRILPLSEAEVF